MEHKGTKEIETSRLLLRPFRREDAAAAFRNWTNDPEVTRYLTWPPHSDVGVTESVISSWAEQYEKPDFYQWAIELNEIGEPIGTISVVGQNEKLSILHIGYCIGQKWWHRGIVSEALSAVMAFLFEEVGANRIESQHDPRNPHSGDVMKKCGMQYEGTLRQADWNNAGIADACTYSALKSEWPPQS